MNMGQEELTRYLWVTYSPGDIWMVFSGIGLLSVIALVLYQWILKPARG
jgi:hypothetical protein